MKCRPVVAAFTVLTFLTQIQGCKKQPADPPVQTETCNPSSFYTDRDTVRITYNDVGNPVSLIQKSTATGSPNSFFKYDQYNRLIEHMAAYSNYDPLNPPLRYIYEQWIKYTYADNNPLSMPVSDTARYVGCIGEFFPPCNVTAWPHDYTYDSEGRVVAIYDRLNKTTKRYDYDANGNLIGANLVYDNQKNISGGNKILQFVNRDYSVNNPFVATEYNAQGLPVRLNKTNVRFIYQTFTLSGVGYVCRVNNSKSGIQ